MLRFLRVTHLAIIDSVEVEFSPGLNVLTGETGAGKSILVEAVGLLLGGRASGDLVRTGEDAAFVEAIFDNADGSEFVVRREITAQGRSRAFIDGVLATAGGLKALAASLVEIHGQHEHQTLLDGATHLGVLDTFAELDPLVAPVRETFNRMRTAADELARLRRAVADRDARLELLTFQLNELEKANLRATAPGDEVGEDIELAALHQVLGNAERVQQLCEESYASLYDRDDAVLAALGHVWRRVAELAALDPKFQPYLDTRDGIKSQLEDLALFLRRYADGIEASPERLQQVQDRLALIDRLKRKYGPTLDDVVARRDGLRRELEELQGGDDRVTQLEREHQAARNEYLAAARALSKARRHGATRLARELERLLGELAMERTRFDVRFTGGPDTLDESVWTETGADIAEFFVSPNPGEDLRPLARIVSGGELSRIMLAIKTLSVGARAPIGASPGLIFDEVDAGIGGRVADVVGRKLQALGATSQVLCITHLPQIAACAGTHFEITKRITGDRTSTTVRKLNHDDRINELARMLGGASITEALRASAREMLKERAGGESERAKGESPKKRR